MFGALLDLLEKGFLVLCLHGEDGFTDKLEDVNVLAEFLCHLV